MRHVLRYLESKESTKGPLQQLTQDQRVHFVQCVATYLSYTQDDLREAYVLGEWLLTGNMELL